MMQQVYTVQGFNGVTLTASLDDCRAARHLGGGWLEIAGQRVSWHEVRDLIAEVARHNGGLHLYYPLIGVRPEQHLEYRVRLGAAPVIDPADQQRRHTGWRFQMLPRASQLAEEHWGMVLHQIAAALIPEEPDEDEEIGIGEDHGDNVHTRRIEWLGH